MARAKSKIEQNYDTLIEIVDTLSSNTVKIYQETVEALKTLDLEVALHIIRHDQHIDDLCEDLTEEAMVTIVRQQPVATDLRKILMIMKVANEYERIADYTKNIAEYIILIKEKESLDHYNKNVDKLVEMMEIVIKMLQYVIQGLKTEDKAIIKEAADMDSEVDAIYQEVLASLIQHIQVVDGKVFGTAYAILINKYIERAGDHVTNIAEEVLFALKGRRYSLN